LQKKNSGKEGATIKRAGSNPSEKGSSKILWGGGEDWELKRTFKKSWEPQLKSSNIGREKEEGGVTSEKTKGRQEIGNLPTP